MHPKNMQNQGLSLIFNFICTVHNSTLCTARNRKTSASPPICSGFATARKQIFRGERVTCPYEQYLQLQEVPVPTNGFSPTSENPLVVVRMYVVYPTHV